MKLKLKYILHDLSGLKKGAIIIDALVYVTMIISIESFTKGMYISITLILREKIRDFNMFLERLEEQKVVKKADQVQELYRLHSRLTSLVESVDNHFSLIVFLWLLVIVFNMCVKIEIIVTGVKSRQYQDLAFILTGNFA